MKYTHSTKSQSIGMTQRRNNKGYYAVLFKYEIISSYFLHIGHASLRLLWGLLSSLSSHHSTQQASAFQKQISKRNFFTRVSPGSKEIPKVILMATMSCFCAELLKYKYNMMASVRPLTPTINESSRFLTPSVQRCFHIMRYEVIL